RRAAAGRGRRVVRLQARGPRPGRAPAARSDHDHCGGVRMALTAHDGLLVLAPPASTAVLVDPLTGLGNHRAFQERLREDLAAMRRRRRPLSLARIDVDRFKAVNDSAGHETGDRALIAIAERL